MGRIKVLREKVAKQEATPEEVEELKELEEEAKPEEAPAETPEETEENADEEVDKLADKFVEKVKPVADKLDAVLKAMEEKKESPEVKVSETRFIVDKSLGKIMVDKLGDIKIALPGREGKTVKEVTGKTVHFINALLTGDKEKIQLLTEGTGAAGGFLVPEEFANLIVEDLRDEVVMRRLATTLTTQVDTLHLPRLDTRPKANWRAEAASKSTSTAQFSELTFTPYSLASIVSLSQELADDATLGVGAGGIVNYVAQLIRQAIAEEQDKAFWTGSGSGRPTGVTTYTVGSIAVAGTDAAHADGIQQLFFRLPQGYRRKAVWVAHRAVLEKIHTLKDANNQYLLRNLESGNNLVMKGLPVFEQNDLPQTEVYLGDFSYYYIVDRQGINVRISDEATVASRSAFEDNLVHVRVETRTDGELASTQAVRKLTNF